MSCKLKNLCLLFTWHKDVNGEYTIRHYITLAELTAKTKQRARSRA